MQFFLSGLQKRTSTLNPRLGLYNGKDFDFIESDNRMFNVIKILWRYGYSIKRLENFLSGMLDKFERSENSHVFKTPKNNFKIIFLF